MLNPSTADAEVDDPTVRRCMEFAQSWGFHTLVITNLFAFRASNPDSLYTLGSSGIIGPFNNQYLQEVAALSSTIVAAWGNNGLLNGRSAFVRKLFRKTIRKPLHCLNLNSSGEPSHPLYLPSTLTPKRMS